MTPHAPRPKPGIWQLTPLRIALVYAVLGALWIAFSDALVAAMAADPATLTSLQTAKGWFYILVTAGLLYALIRRSQTAIRQAAETARRSEEQLRLVTDALPVLVSYVDAQQRYRFNNRAYEEWFGQPRALVEGRHIREVLGEAAYERIRDHVEAALAGRAVTYEARVPYREGAERWIHATYIPHVGARGEVEGFVALVSDISERKQAEAERERLLAEDQRRATELQRLKDQFIQVAAHELKTPVTIMKGYAQALVRAGGASAAQRKMFDSIDRGADRIARIIEDLLDISVLQAGSLELRREPIELAGLVEEQVDRLALAAAKHRLRLLEAQPVVVQGDRGRLEQVVASLLDNAVRYSPAGGDVDVAVVVEGNEAIVSVADRGVGIPVEKQGRIFERFYRAHTNTPYDYGGMGVGLFIASEIVRRHGGRIWFESEEGKGSTFHFALPLVGE